LSNAEGARVVVTVAGSKFARSGIEGNSVGVLEGVSEGVALGVSEGSNVGSKVGVKDPPIRV
jgi:hypothetical protein